MTRNMNRNLKQITHPVWVGAWFVAGLVCGLQAQAAHWPAFRGSNANGVADEDRPPIHFGPASNLVWKIDLPPGHSSPIIWQDHLFVTAAEGRQLSTLCLDRSDGKKRWGQSVSVDKLEKVHSANSVATPTPVTDGQAVYVYFGSFGLLAYDFEGKELWRKPLPMPKTFRDQGTSTSPILAEGKLVLFVQIARDSHLLALNPKDGSEVWRAPMPMFNTTWATPVYWREGGQGCVGLSCANRFTAFRVADGKEAWWVGGLGFETCATPVVVGDRLVMTAAGVQGERANLTVPPAFEEFAKKHDRDGDGLIAYDEIPSDLLYTDRQASKGQGNASLRQALSWFAGMKKEEKLDRTRWEELRGRLREFSESPINETVVMAVRTGGSQEVTRSHVLWQETKGVPETPSPVVYQGRVYLVRSGGMLVCRELETGKLVYENRLDSPGAYFASPVAANGCLYVASDRGAVTVIKAGDAFSVLACNQLNERIVASPAVVDSVLYIRSTKQLWAFGE